MDIRRAQRTVWTSKVTTRSNTREVPLEFMLLHGKIAESFQAWRRKEPGLGEELADVAIALLGLATMVDVDLETEIQRKLGAKADEF